MESTTGYFVPKTKNFWEGVSSLQLHHWKSRLCHAEIERYIKLDRDADFDPLIRAICIVGKGYWYYRRDTTASGDSIGKWWCWEANKEHDEVMSFLGAILNTIPDSIASRGRPRYGKYIITNEGTPAREVFWKFDKKADQWVKRNISPKVKKI